MTNYYKYLPTSSGDESWGLHVLNTGCNRISSGEMYPSTQHPAHHYFNWNKGRILDEYQIIYIAKGEGLFESEGCKQQKVNEGTVLLLFPGEWHRFKPSKQTGWDEYWVGYKGAIMENLVRQRFFCAQKAILHVGVSEGIIDLLEKIIETTKKEKTGYQPLVSGAIVHLLGEIHSIIKQGEFETEDNTESIINKARVIFRTGIDDEMTIENIAEELNVSYAWFRKAFKMYTGIAPHQYLLQLKIEKAKILLGDHSTSIKEIAFNLNFNSAYYFSKLFKEKAGVSPAQFRNNKYGKGKQTR